MRSTQRGVTLLELMMSLVVIVVGMLAIFRVISTSVRATSSSSRVAQAQQRASAIIEAIRLAPGLALSCLENTPAAGWSNCESTCMANQLPLASPAGGLSNCIFTTDSFKNISGPLTNKGGVPVSNQQYDRQGQQYFLNTWKSAPPTVTLPAQYAATYVRVVGDPPLVSRTAEIAISIGWNDDNSGWVANKIPDHSITLVSGVLQ